MKKNLIVDCFAGGGGASVGIEMALGRPVDIAINHDPDAILMHKTNHPNTLHLTEDIFKVNLRKYVKDQHVALMWASPDCTSHSKAKGGKPRERGLRILPWAVYKHAKEILPDVILMENVEEIQQWGPLDEKGYPIPERKGEDYQKFIRSMKALGYIFDCRELVAADYGAPTTRKRWYAVFRRDGKEIRWPEPTHSRENTSLRHWEECGNYIDWSDLGTSIFNRKKPLAEATQKRIANGIKKYITDAPAPYIVKDKDALAFIIQYHGETRDGDSRGQLLTEPIMAQKLVEANCPYLKVGVRVPNLNIDDSQEQLFFIRLHFLDQLLFIWIQTIKKESFKLSCLNCILISRRTGRILISRLTASFFLIRTFAFLIRTLVIPSVSRFPTANSSFRQIQSTCNLNQFHAFQVHALCLLYSFIWRPGHVPSPRFVVFEYNKRQSLCKTAYDFHILFFFLLFCPF